MSTFSPFHEMSVISVETESLSPQYILMCLLLASPSPPTFADLHVPVQVDSKPCRFPDPSAYLLR